MAFIYGNERVVRVTIRADVFHEFWFEFIWLTVGLIGYVYDLYAKSKKTTIDDRPEVT